MVAWVFGVRQAFAERVSRGLFIHGDDTNAG
jgi:hypothetical protein